MSDPPSPPPGFTGQRSHVLATAVDGAHTVTLAWYTFPRSVALVPYVELSESHDGARPGRVMALSTLVHLAQNVGDDEVWQIGGREIPGGESVETQLTAARATIARLNRRAQQAEAIADRCVAGRPQAGRSLGRALANYAASRLAAVALEAIEGWEDAVTCVDISAAERAASGADLARLRARLDVLTGGGERATVPAMASPHGPPPTKSLPSLLDGLISQAQEIARLHPKALHAAAILALAEASRRECGGEPTPEREP